MALTATAQSALPIVPSWGETIVPTLRKRTFTSLSCSLYTLLCNQQVSRTKVAFLPSESLPLRLSQSKTARLNFLNHFIHTHTTIARMPPAFLSLHDPAEYPGLAFSPRALRFLTTAQQHPQNRVHRLSGHELYRSPSSWTLTSPPSHALMPVQRHQIHLGLRTSSRRAYPCRVRAHRAPPAIHKS